MKRKIAIISEHASPLATLGGADNGGQNVYVAHIARQLAKAGNLVDVFTRKDRKELPQIMNWENGIRVIHVPAGPAEFVPKEKMFSYMRQFTDFMTCIIQHQEGPYQVIHANFWMSGLVAADIKQALGIPFVITFHALGRVRRIYQGKDDGFPDQRFEIEDRIVREADKIIAECPQDRQDLIDLYHASAKKIKIIPCGFDPDELWPIDKQIARAFLGIPQDERVILQLGRMVRRKGIDTAICGFAKFVNETSMPARMLVVGGETDLPDPKASPEIGRLMEIAQAEGIPDKVHFVGRRNRRFLKYYYSAADVFISTPWYEPFGITPVEAMACRTPVIGSAVGGLKYTIENSKTGFLIPPNDPIALADRLEYLLTNENAIAQLGWTGAQRANREFTWKRVAKTIAETYDQVICRTAADIPAVFSCEVLPLQQHMVREGINGLIDALRKTETSLEAQILACAQVVQASFNRGNKVLICGNGGSAADAQHFAGELVGRFRMASRPALPAIALTTDTSILTAWANDVGFEKVFSRQVEAYGQPGDILIGISTSGNSANLVEAFKAAGQKGVTRMAILGGNGGDLLPLSDLSIIVPSTDPQRIQEVQIFIIHMICELIERQIVEQAEINAKAFSRSENAWIAKTGAAISVSYDKSE